MAYLENQALDPQEDPQPNRVDGVAASTSIPLPAGGIYDTGWIDLTGYMEIYTTMLSDVPSASGGIMVMFSGDGNTILSQNTRTYDDVETFFRNPFPINTRYVRYRYTNGGVAQSKFWFQVFLSTSIIGTSNFDLNQRLNMRALVQSNRSVIELPNSSGEFDILQRDGNALLVKQTNPIDASTLASQATLSTLNDKVPSKGQKTSSGSVPVVIASDQTLPISGTVSLSGTPIAVSISGTPTVNSNVTFPSNQNVTVSNFPSTQPVSGTFWQTTQPVSGTLAISNTSFGVNNFPSVQAISATSLPLPTSASTASNQTAIINSLASLDSKTISSATAGSASAISLVINANTTIAANANRKCVHISCVTGVFFIGIGFTPTATSYSYRVIPNGVAVIPLTEGAPLAITIFSNVASTGTSTLIV